MSIVVQRILQVVLGALGLGAYVWYCVWETKYKQGLSPSERATFNAQQKQCRSCSVAYACPVAVMSQNDGRCPNWKPKTR